MALRGDRVTGRRAAGLLGAAWLCLVVPGAYAETRDAFDPSKWPGASREFPARSSAQLTRIQEVNAKQLLLGLSAKGGPRTETNDFNLANPNTINAIEAKVTLLDINVPAADGGSSQAGIHGFFYWDGTGTGSSTDSKGHVIGHLMIDADEVAQAVEIRLFVGRCTDSSCSLANLVVYTEQTVATGVKLFQTYRLKLSYDNGTGTFTAEVDGSVVGTFTVPDATRRAPTNQLKTLRTRIRNGADPNVVGRAVAAFDDVLVNGAVYESFDAKTLPRVQILPESGTFPSTQTFDVVIMVEAGNEVLTDARLVLNGNDVTSNVLAAGIIQGLASGGLYLRVPKVLIAAFVPPNTTALFGAEITFASGATARGYATWRVVPVVE